MSGIGIARGRHIAYDSGAAGAQHPSLAEALQKRRHLVKT